MMDIEHYPLSLIAIVGFVVVAGFTLSAIAARFTAVGEEEPRAHRVPKGSGIRGAIGVLFFIGLLLFSGLILTYRMVETDSRHRLDQEQSETSQRVEAQRAEVEAVATASAEPSATETPASRELPEWTRTPMTVVKNGAVDQVTLVAQSELCATPGEALEEATVRAMADLQDRIATAWPELDSWPLPAELFRRNSIQREPYVEIQKHEFGGVQEPMYRVFIQYEDSATVREHFLDRWRDDVQLTRTLEYALGLGGMAIGLGVISAFLRGLLAVSKRRRKTVATAP